MTSQTELKTRVRRLNDAMDDLEDALVRGFTFTPDMKIAMEDVGPLMEASRAVLAAHRGVALPNKEISR